MISRDSESDSRSSDGGAKTPLYEAKRGGSEPASVNGAVFCGGKSVRMGSDKAVLLAPGGCGKSLLENAIDILDGVASRVFLASGATPRYEELGRQCVLDSIEGAGPLAGLASALEASRSEWLCVLACDMPTVTVELFEQLLAEGESKSLDICLIESVDGVEPLCAVYRVTCLDAVRASLAKGERRMVAFHKSNTAAGRPLAVGTIRAAELFGSDACVENLNTQADYARVLDHQLPKNVSGESW